MSRWPAASSWGSPMPVMRSIGWAVASVRKRCCAPSRSMRPSSTSACPPWRNWPFTLGGAPGLQAAGGSGGCRGDQLRTPLAGLQAQVEAWAMMARAAVPAPLSLNFDKKHPLTQDGRAPGAIVLGVDKIEKLRNAIGPPRVFLQVEDDGPGVPQAERGRVMQRFLPGSRHGGRGHRPGAGHRRRDCPCAPRIADPGAGGQGRGLVVTVVFPPEPPAAGA